MQENFNKCLKKLGKRVGASVATAHTGCMSGRFGATIEQIGHDLTEGIDGKNDIVSNTGHAIRNAVVATWHALNGVVPSIVNAFSGQQYQVVERTGALDGTKASLQKIVHTNGILGKASAVLLEATDGPVDDLFAMAGGARHMIVPVRGSAYKTLNL